MKITTLKVGSIRTNCYIVEDEATKKALVIDAGAEPERILGLLQKNGLKLELIIATHGHFDHLEGVRRLKEKTGARFLMHQADLFGLKTTDAPQPDGFLADSNTFEVGGLRFEVLHTPGHSPGGISLYNEKEQVLFSGDTLFQGTYGRVDLPFSDEGKMINSLQRLLKLPPETVVYPGHGNATTIGAERNVIKTAW
ncbi:MAG: MBL fold metallo-hydrolase [Candidatus Margulisiibacteriota bacterium]